MIVDLEWSPSGEWLAWSSRVFGGPGFTTTKVRIVSSDGQRRIALLDEAYDVRLLAWSAEQDWLFVIHQEQYPSTVTTYVILDVGNNRILAEHIERRPAGSEPPSWFPQSVYRWTAGDTGIHIQSTGVTDIVVTYLSIDGRSDNWFFNSYAPLLDFHHGRLVNERYAVDENGFVSELVVTDIATNEHRVLLPQAEYSLSQADDYDAYWSPSGQLAVIEHKTCVNRRCTVDFSELYSWETEARVRLPANLRIAECSDFERCLTIPEVWSPDEQRLLLQDAQGRVYAYDIATAITHRLTDEPLWKWFWVGNAQLMYFIEQEKIIVRHDLERRTAITSARFNERVIDIAPSPDGQYIGLAGGSQVKVMTAWSGEYLTWPRHSITSGAGPVMGYKWQEDGPWFFSGGNTQTADYCCNSRAIMLHHLDNPSRRELTRCYNIDTCAGFLPERVLPHLSPGQDFSHTPTPAYSLTHDLDILDVAWSPDGAHLAACGSTQEWEWEHFVVIWDVRQISSATEIVRFKTDLQCRISRLRWQNNTVIELSYGTQGQAWDVPTRISRYLTELNPWSASPSSRYEVLASTRYRQVRIVDRYTGMLRLLVRLEEMLDNSLIWSTTEDYLLIQQPDDPFYFWDTMSLYRLENGDYGRSRIDYHPETGLLVAAGLYHFGQIWHVPTGKRLTPPVSAGPSAVFAPDGRWLAVAGTQYITIWDMQPYISEAHH
jgi:WD40 repeat protein